MSTTAPSSTDRIEKSIELRAPIDRVWRALTDHREFGRWFRAEMESPFVVGKISRGRSTSCGYEHVLMEFLVEAIEPQRRFAYRWHPFAVDPKVDYAKEPKTLVEFLLEPTASGTLLRVVESGFDALPESRRAEALRMNTGGWEQQMRNVASHVHA